MIIFLIQENKKLYLQLLIVLVIKRFIVPPPYLLNLPHMRLSKRQILLQKVEMDFTIQKQKVLVIIYQHINSQVLNDQNYLKLVVKLRKSQDIDKSVLLKLGKIVEIKSSLGLVVQEELTHKNHSPQKHPKQPEQNILGGHGNKLLILLQ